MIYSDLYVHKENKLPATIGFLLVIFITFIFLRFYLGLAGSSKASLKVAKRVEIVNLSPTQASIFWQTDQKESGWVVYGDSEDHESKIILDEKDLSSLEDQKGKYLTHLVTLKELVPGKKYFFKIITDDNKIIVQPDKKSFSFKTPKTTLNSLQNISPAFGRVLSSNSIDPLINSYIILSVKNSYSLLTQIKPTGDGSWLIPLNQIYSKDSENIQTISDKDKIIVEIITSDGEGLTITTIKSKISPLPQTIIFSKNQNFSFIEDDNVLSAFTSLDTVIKDQPEIIYPKEGSLIPGTIPLIKGIALPLSDIKITVNSKKTFSAIIKSDSKGNWSYLIPENLELGPHVITIRTKNKEGNEIKKIRKFTMIAQQGNEGRVLGTATGEPTIIFTVTPKPTTISVYNSAIPTIKTKISTTPPVTGSNYSKTIFSGFALIIIGGGIFLAF